MNKIEEVARAMAKRQNPFAIDDEGHWRTDPDPWRNLASTAIKAMRNLSTQIQMEGATHFSLESVTIDGAIKPHEECVTPDDWMRRGGDLAKRMVSGREFMAGWRAAIDAILSEEVP